MLRRLLPPGVIVHEAFEDPVGAVLHPEEEPLVARAVDSRRREFTTVRHCARAALRELGRPEGPVLPDRHGAPRWPDSVVGSLTHCAGYRAAALAEAGDFLMIGVDAEPHGPLPDGVEEVIALPAERARLAAERRARPLLHFGRVLFSAKESIYKSWYTHTGQRLDFESADIAFEVFDGLPGDDDGGAPPAASPGTVAASGSFTARLTGPRGEPLARPALPGGETGVLRGRWLIERDLVVTAIAVVAPGARGGRAEELEGPVGIRLGGSGR
ncbi:4'-phosphopantetheinyl transferase [Streptomyces sp. NPDC057638]|uniref:4'-phosphopantetheinyl transferase family protein n=1 Tax=Streptomyces sp. NPDC057638 TaxID=3346190 RepID=UPI003673EAFF